MGLMITMLGTTSPMVVDAASHAGKTLTVRKVASIPAGHADSIRVPLCTTNAMPLSRSLPHLLLGTTSQMAANAASHVGKTLTVRKVASIPAGHAESIRVPLCITNAMHPTTKMCLLSNFFLYNN